MIIGTALVVGLLAIGQPVDQTAAPGGAAQPARPPVHPGVAGPVPVASKPTLGDHAARPYLFADAEWFHWGGTPVRGDDGVYHLYYDRWPRRNPRLMRGWLYVSEIAHATAEQPEGPYTFRDVVLKGPGDDPKGRWDAFNAHNACCVRLPDPATGVLRYYLYFIANRDDDTMKDDWFDRIVNQRIGVAIADSPDGPWTRHPKPVCVPGAPLLSYVVNPGVCRLPDGRYLMLLKGRAKETVRSGEMGAMLHGWALADSPIGPFVIQKSLLFPERILAEDPCVFVWNGVIYAAVKDWRGHLSGTPGIAWLSGSLGADGSIAWSVPADPLVSRREITWTDGTSTTLHTLERRLFCRTARGGRRTCSPRRR